MREEYRDHTFESIRKAYKVFEKNDFKRLNALNSEYELENLDQSAYDFTLNQCKKFNILNVKWDKIISTRVQDLELYLVNELLRLWTKDEYIQNIVKQFQSEWTRDITNDATLFYFSLVFRKATVNIYLFDDDITIKTAYGHNWFVQHYNYHKNHTVINLNTYISKQYEENFASTVDHSYYLSESERSLISNVRDDDYQKDKIIVSIKENKIKWFDVFGREYDLSRLAELDQKIEYGELGKKKHEWWAKFITIQENKRFK